MNPRHRPDLDLQLPFHDGPGFPPPILDMEQDLRFIEINREILRENGTLADNSQSPATRGGDVRDEVSGLARRRGLS